MTASAPPPSVTNPVRRLTQVFVAFLCGFLLIRTVALEPFGVPTGSMAPALIGNHRTVNCPRCDAPVTVGEPGPDARAIKFEACRCPNCEQAVDLAAAREVPGDRLMVDKTVFHARSPRRWEVAVFRCPADLSKPYVKRVVGLPGERVEISGGDVYADGELLRKTMRQVRETRVLAFALAHAPAGGWSDRWLVQPLAADPKLPPLIATRAERPADELVLRDGALHLDGVAHPEGVGLTYRHLNLDTRREEPLHDFLAYNGQPPDRKLFARSATAAWGDPVHDFVAVFDLEIVAGSGVFACRLTDNVESVHADIPVGIQDAPTVQVAHDGGAAPLSRPVAALAVGSTYRVEFAFVDRRAMLAIDGRDVLPPLDLPADPAGQPRKRQTARPVQFGVRGATVAVKNFELFRDVHYLSAAKSPRGWQLPAGEFFVLGDNTSSSHDSRVWEIDGKPAPGVPEDGFLGKPFLIHQPMRPARLTVNGRERRMQSPDWGRIRWLR